jgi:hypothetical protein
LGFDNPISFFFHREQMKPSLALLILCAVSVTSPAAEAQQFVNFDARQQSRAGTQTLTGDRQTAASELKRRVPGVLIDLDAVTGAPS